MTETAQTIAAIVVVLAAIVYLFLRARKKATCGKGDCGCTPRKPL
jgi:hypothetical protein